LTEAERAHVTLLLRRTRDDFLTAVEPLTSDQWAFQPGPDRWSIGLIAEHLGLVESRLFGQVERALREPANPNWESASGGKGALITTMLANRETPRAAPEPVIPTGAVDRAAALGVFQERRAHTLAFAETTRESLKSHTLDHHRPTYGTLNAYQWLLYIPLHHQRHLDQIDEVKAAPGFPPADGV
jgi:hypothetical protein